MSFRLPLIFLAVLSALVAKPVDVYFGTGGRDAKGIYQAKFDVEKGTLSEATLAIELEKPGFLAFHPNRKTLYAVGMREAEPVVAAYAVVSDGALEFLNEVPIPDGRACHLSVHPSGNFLITAQYGGGSVGVFPLSKDGMVQACSQLIEHEGASGHSPRQQSPHPHWTGFSPDGRFAFIPDLGMDQIVVYQVQSDQQSIKQVGAMDSVPGGGPRHMRFSVDGEFIFLLNELSLSVSTFACGAEAGTGELVSTTPTLSPAMKKKESFNSSSEIVVHPNGKYVYAGNRGSDTVTAFQVDPETGRLYVTDIEPIRGAWPRNINLDSSGRWLLAAGAHSNTVTVFEIDQKTGALTYPRGHVFNVPNAICILLND